METDKVSVESLHTTRIKEISYEGEEIFEEKPTVSQHLTELAQRVDFSESDKDEPASKKSTQKWPWEFTHSKLKQALTEVSVLSDLLEITQNHSSYVVLDPVADSQPTFVSPCYQYLVKKKALGVAAGILKAGTKSLSRTFSQSEFEFHKALSQMRTRWRLRRTPVGIVGDISYQSAGSIYSAVAFGVSKGERLTSNSPDGDIISVTIPRELRGRSETLVFLSDSPVREVESLDSYLQSSPFEDFRRHNRRFPPWETKLLAAQDILFNRELFMQLTREAYDQKAALQYEVFTDRINVPVGLKQWVSILHVREYEEKPKKNKESSRSAASSSSSSSSKTTVPPPHWGLVVALKQLLRDNHHQKTALVSPKPSTASFNEPPALRTAGVNTINERHLKDLDYNYNIFNRFISKAKHICNEKLFQEWLMDICGSCGDPVLRVKWVPDLLMASTVAHLHMSSQLPGGTHSSRLQEPPFQQTVEISLRVDTIRFHNKGPERLDITVNREKFVHHVRHQVLMYQMQLACRIASQHKWRVVQQHVCPLPSPALAKGPGFEKEACNVVMESADTSRNIDVLLEWGKVTVSYMQLVLPKDESVSEQVYEERGRGAAKDFTLDSQFGQTFHERFVSMLNTISSQQ